MNSQTSDNKFLVTHPITNTHCAESLLYAYTLDTYLFHSRPDDTKTKVCNHTYNIYNEIIHKIVSLNPCCDHLLHRTPTPHSTCTGMCASNSVALINTTIIL